MDGAAVVMVVFTTATVVIPIALCVVVRRRQKRGQWSGGFTPDYRKWTMGEDDEHRPLHFHVQQQYQHEPPGRTSGRVHSPFDR